ncbi:MAG: hypothetical protein OXC68_09215 [Aestuariivita sp.]|nr:hypothetical protein [Aestuariivita sp.]
MISLYIWGHVEHCACDQLELRSMIVDELRDSHLPRARMITEWLSRSFPIFWEDDMG